MAVATTVEYLDINEGHGNMIRTALGHERTSNERGSRFWSAAELMTPTWFVIEACVNVSGRNEVRQWLTPSIELAVQIQRSSQPYTWTRIFACIRAPLSIQRATLFEVVLEAYKAGSRDSYFLILDNGLSFCTGTEARGDITSQPEALKLIYKSGQ